jgi:eukaryotic-like serine/threonine-protein kinase
VIDLGGARWGDDWPMALVDWHGANAYAAWRASLDGQPWRLPNELEWEKAARGADGRTWPWGNHFEPAWTHASGSTADVPQRVPIGTMPHDVSPYGVQGMAGNVRDWCANPWTEAGPDVVDQRLMLGMASPADNVPYAVRGGSFGSTAHLCRAATRFGSPPTARFRSLGFRLVRALPIPAP